MRCSRDEEICFALGVADELEVAAPGAEGGDVLLLRDVQ